MISLTLVVAVES